MKKIILYPAIICTLFNVQGAFAQTKLDSLYSVWQDKTKPDSTRALAYKNYIFKEFLYSNPDTASILADELIAFGKITNCPSAQADGLNIKGGSNSIRGNNPKAMDYYMQSLKIAEQLGDRKRMANALSNIGAVQNNQGDKLKALNYYIRSLKIQKQLGDKMGMAITLGGIGILYYEQGDSAKGLDYYTQSLNIREQLGDQLGIAIAHNSIGNLYMDHGNYPKALDHFTRALKNAEQHDSAIIGVLLNNIGMVQKKQGNYPKALDHFTRALKNFEQLGNKSGIALTQTNIGTVHTLQGNYQEALAYCHKGYDLALSIGELMRQTGACECLYDTYKVMGNGNEALVYMEKMNVIDDSLNTKETAKKLQQMEFAKQVFVDSMAQVETDRLVEEAHQEEVAQKNKTRNILAGGGLIVLLIAGAVYSRLRYVRKAKDIIEKEKDRSNNLLLNILPADIAEELKIHGKAKARDFDMVSMLFTDFKGFTAASAKLSAAELVNEINTCFEAFDGIMEKYGIEKIKTIGDAYMAAGGLPVPSDVSIKNTALAALEMQDFVGKRKAEMDVKNLPAFEMRVGIHTGPVVTGIVGVKKFQYDIWGDTVNTASRMESHGEVGKVNISQATYELIKGDAQFTFEHRGMVEAKGKGEMGMYFVRLT